MTNLSRRGLFGVVGLLATVPITSSTTEVSAPEQFPLEGHTFCDACEGEGWQDRFGADIDARNDHFRYDVLFNGTKHRWTFAAKAGPNGWIAEAVRNETYDYGDVSLLTCDCGIDPYHLQFRITYGNVELVDHWKGSV